MSNSEQEDISFESALSESLGDVTQLSGEESAAFKNLSARRDNEMLAKQLKRAAISEAIQDESNPLSISLRQTVDPDDMLSFKRPGIQDGVFKNLRLGKYGVEALVDLQRLRINDCRNELYQKIQSNHELGVRTLLVKHGRGYNSQPVPALTKSYVAQWLQEMSEVIAFHSAQRLHGSLAATYVLLKKHPNQKQINREKLFRKT